MTGLNVIFMGNLLYPEGLAETKRVQHFIDGVMAGQGTSAQVLLLRQSHPGRNDSLLSGEKRGVPFETIGHDVRANIALPLTALRYVVGGCHFFWRARHKDRRNVLFVYGEPNVESFLFVIWAKCLGYRVVVDIVEDSYAIVEAAPLLSRLKARSVQWSTGHIGWFADGIVVISIYLKEKLEKIVGDSRPVMLIPVSVDLDRVVDSAAGFHQPVRMLYAGTFSEKDGVENLIAGFEQIAAQSADIEFLLTGRGSADRIANIQHRIALSPFANRIRYLGYLSDDEYFSVISNCDIPCVVRVATEYANRGFPFKLGEYLATGRPVVAARVSDVGTYLTDRVNAMLVEAGSVPGIVAAIRYLLADQARALELGRAGRLVAAEHFCARENGLRLREFIDRIASK